MLIPYENGIFAVDAHYVRPNVAAIHLIVQDGRAALVDTGCNDSVPNALAALEHLSIPMENVDFVILTHVHLDHAGGASAMMRRFPNARLVVHPRGARHMANPSRLIEGTIAVYGAEATRRLYGDILPIDAARIVEATHEMRLDLAGRELVCLDTPGHARHHNAILDSITGNIFTGDIFGVSFRELDTDGRQFVFPTTTPIQFDPPSMHRSIDMLMDLRPQAVYLTHFGRVSEPRAKADELHRLVDAFVAIAQREKDTGAERYQRIRTGLSELLLEETQRFGCRLSPAEVLRVHTHDLDLDAQGLCVWLDNSV